MTIIGQNKGIIANYDNIQEIFIGADRTTIKIDFTSGRGCEAARYPAKEDCLLALERLSAAIEAGDKVFEFPQKIERHGINRSKQK